MHWQRRVQQDRLRRWKLENCHVYSSSVLTLERIWNIDKKGISIFYKSGLVEIPITETEEGLGFVDDFSAWVVGDTASENLFRIQNEVIPLAIEWARASGAEFEKTQTELIHFTRHPKIRDHTGLSFLEQALLHHKTLWSYSALP